MRDTTLDVAGQTPSHTEPPIVSAERRTIAGRYRLLERLGKGGFGTVWRSHDTVTDTYVAVKLLSFRDATDIRKFRDEVALLRLLDLPGVVRLLDDGVDERTPFLVTEIVDGERFPRAPSRDAAGWEAIARPTYALLEALSRVHHVGVVHRDLKPANVLVSAKGVPTILDFGVSWGPGFTASEKGSSLGGTPIYLAPEQAMGAPGDDRTDLYTLGVMLFESLSGRLPHRAKDAEALLSAKVNSEPLSLREIAPYVPYHVATVIDQMLRVNPRERPASAATVLELIGGARAHRQLPRLGDPELVAQIGNKLLRGVSVNVFGAAGSGRSRLLRDVAAWLRERDAEVLEVSGMTYGDELSEVLEAQADSQRSGLCVTVEDPVELDDEVKALLKTRRDGCPTLRVVTDEREADLVIPGLVEEDLRALFHGPDRVLHLVEDGARELRRRIDGTPRHALHVLNAWERAGLCHWDGDRVRIEREALDRLGAGLQVQTSYSRGLAEPESIGVTDAELEVAEWVHLAGEHASVSLVGDMVGKPPEVVQAEVSVLIGAGVMHEEDGSLALLDTLPRDARWSVEQTQAARSRLVESLETGANGRFAHLLQAHNILGLVEEAVLIAEEAEHTGRVSQAFALVGEAMNLAAREEHLEGWGELLGHYAVLALSAQSPRHLDVALYACSRAMGTVPGAAGIWELLDAARIVRYVERTNERALRTAMEVHSFEGLELERWRRAIVVQAGYCLPPDEHARMAEEHMAWATGKGVDVMASVRGWLGNVRFRQGDFSEAASCHLTAFEEAHSATVRMASAANAAKALIECEREEEAMVMAQSAADLAAELRMPCVELRALWLGRSVAYRARRTEGMDPELVEVALRMSMPSERSLVLMTEAAAAWRAGDDENAGRLALECARAFDASGQPAASLIVRGLAYRCGALERCEQVDAELQTMLKGQPEWLAGQARALWSPDPLGPDTGARMDILATGEIRI